VKGTPTHIRETWLLCSILSGEDINSIIRLNTKLHPADNRQTLSAIMNDATRNLYFFSGG
jgi:hypothetical protein